MHMNMLMSIIEHYGYVAIFFLLWLGIVGLPIPDELVVATGGFLGSIGLLDPFYAFLFGYLGVSSGLSIGYFLGKWFGKPILDWLSKKEKMEKTIQRSTALIHRYGTYSLCFSYLFPVVRHLVPYIVAMGGMTYRRYALIAYPIGLLWTAFFYFLGHFFGKSMESIVELTRRYGFYALGAVVLLIVLLLIVRRLVRTNKSYNTEKEGE
ncbi:DedA family protein [Brevibacillus fulvus]|uniref:Membrane protein DedA with SNARE-associated domain n=1 Tax=Brevibacillus fulvus TaxID=1125967 RepID=A0A938XYP4_9BACL|nr:DedA family protein [Brevibacillus fulvus]MBM7590120.1 membrane protein DedA with SNARE-associated domain [Brevibacillus fulvus]